MAGLATAALIGGSLLGGVGSIVQGASAASAQRAQAAAVERQGNEEAAASQREAIQRQKEADQVLSRQQAVAAASGGSASDTTILNLQGDTAAQGQYNVSSAVYEGKAAEAGAKDQAAIYRMQAKQSLLSGFIGAGSTLLSGISAYNRYQPATPYSGTTLPMLPATYSGYRATA